MASPLPPLSNPGSPLWFVESRLRWANTLQNRLRIFGATEAGGVFKDLLKEAASIMIGFNSLLGAVEPHHTQFSASVKTRYDALEARLIAAQAQFEGHYPPHWLFEEYQRFENQIYEDLDKMEDVTLRQAGQRKLDASFQPLVWYALLGKTPSYEAVEKLMQVQRNLERWASEPMVAGEERVESVAHAPFGRASSFGRLSRRTAERYNITM